MGTEILNLIRKEYDENGINTDVLNNIIKLCGELILENKRKLYSNNFKNFAEIQNLSLYESNYSKKLIDSDPIQSNLSKEFIEEFEKEIEEKYHTTERIYCEMADILFANNKNKIEIYLGQEGDNIIFCIYENNKYFKINDVEEYREVMPERIEEFNNNFGSVLDDYRRNLKLSEVRNTRRFEITRNVYEYLKNNNFESLLFFPSICMDDDKNNPEKISYKHRYTYMITFGNKSSDYQEFPNVSIFDRNGLCPPGNC